MSSPDVMNLLEKADRSLAAAGHLLMHGFPEFAVGRAYYAMLYSAQALLLSQDLTFSKHSAVIAAFGKHFVKTGILDASLHRYFLEAFDLRNLADYGAVRTIDDADAHPVLENASVFCIAIKKHLASLD